MKNTTDFIIIGSGVAGLRAATELEPYGHVTILTKSRADESNTEYAQGGVAVAMSDEDEIGLHHDDTIRAGDGLCNEAAVQILVEEGPRRIQQLIDWGTEFDRDGSKLAFTREAAHSRKRVLHAQGDATGREINRTLLRKVHSLVNITVLPYTFALRLLVGDRGCEGVKYLSEIDSRIQEVRGQAVLLASGGIGATYRDTTNPDIATGDGQALAFHAGAALADMEFVQFHPTALKLTNTPRFLLSEAMRGEGGKLKNRLGESFMAKYHPMAELAPRDVVSRAIAQEAGATGSEVVYLDLTHLPDGFVEHRFPGIFSTCQRFGLDIRHSPIPVFPAAHYIMGGVLTDLDGRTTIPGLFAAGEVACTGVHGANRLASNSLLEGLVYGARAGCAMAAGEAAAYRPDWRHLCSFPWETHQSQEAPSEEHLRNTMTELVGIMRHQDALKEAQTRFSATSFSPGPDRASNEFNNKLTNARVITASALSRLESRGAHFRSDYPERNDADWKKRLVACYDASRKRLEYTLLNAAEKKNGAGTDA